MGGAYLVTSALPAAIKYGTITGKIVQAVMDSTDADTHPDSIPAQGNITFTPSLSSVFLTTAPPTVVNISPITVPLAADGSFSVELVATDNLSVNPVNWTYTVTTNLVGSNVSFTPFVINVPGGQTIDLTALMLGIATNTLVLSTGTYYVFFSGNEPVKALGSVTGAVTCDLSLASNFTLTLTGNTTITFTNAAAGKVNYVTLRVTQDTQATAWTLEIVGRQGSFGANALSNLSATPGATDKIVTESWDSGSHWDVAIAAQAIS